MPCPLPFSLSARRIIRTDVDGSQLRQEPLGRICPERGVRQCVRVVLRAMEYRTCDLRKLALLAFLGRLVGIIDAVEQAVDEMLVGIAFCEDRFHQRFVGCGKHAEQHRRFCRLDGCGDRVEKIAFLSLFREEEHADFRSGDVCDLFPLR